MKSFRVFSSIFNIYVSKGGKISTDKATTCFVSFYFFGQYKIIEKKKNTF